MIRLYGPVVGNGSLVRVAAGMRHALAELGLLAGFVPIDIESDETDGYDADEAVYVGPAPGACVMTSAGWHKRRFALLGPNSTWVPSGMLELLARHATDLVTPSEWAAGILRQQDYSAFSRADGSPIEPLPVSVWPHGVEPAFAPSEADFAALTGRYEQGHFSIVHLASTTMQRKGTRELIQAFCKLSKARLLGAHPHLTIIVDGTAEAFAGLVERGAFVHVRPRVNANPRMTAAIYQMHHVVCQPSRGEAFGMCPAEARACGAVVAATWCTGQDHVLWRPEGETETAVLPIPTGPDAPIDDGPGAMAPALDVDDVADALQHAYENWAQLAATAQKHADAMRREWTWTRGTERWLASRS